MMILLFLINFVKFLKVLLLTFQIPNFGFVNVPLVTLANIKESLNLFHNHLPVVNIYLHHLL